MKFKPRLLIINMSNTKKKKKKKKNNEKCFEIKIVAK